VYKTNEVLKEFKEYPKGLQLQIMSRIDLKTQNSVGNPDLSAWEDTCDFIEAINDYEALVLALVSH